MEKGSLHAAVIVGRVDALQSLRGLAALAVLVNHASLVFELPRALRLTIDSVFNAHAAVMLFFVLSGYVLAAALSFKPQTIQSTAIFYIRRLFRIYPAIIVAVIFALIVARFLHVPFEPSLYSAWSTGYLNAITNFDSQSFKAVAGAMIPINFRLLPPSWSLFAEIIGSAVIPILILVLTKTNRIQTTILLIIILAASLQFSGMSYGIQFCQFIWHFALGVLVYRLIAAGQLQIRKFIWAATAGLALLIFTRAIVHGIENGSPTDILFKYDDPILTMVEGIFAAIVVAAVALKGNALTVLNNPNLVRLGDYSYGIYLLHFPVMLLVAQMLSAMWNTSPMWLFLATLVLTFIGTVGLSILLFKFIEMPFIKLGKSLTWHR